MELRKSDKKLICWDSSVMISWLKGTEQERMKDVDPVAQKILQGRYHLVVSALLYPEILESTMSREAIENFCKFMQDRERVEIVAVDIRVAKKAQKIRNKIKLKTPDAVHVATAIISGAAVLHTYDEALLKLNETPVMDGLSGTVKFTV